MLTSNPDAALGEDDEDDFVGLGFVCLGLFTAYLRQFCAHSDSSNRNSKNVILTHPWFCFSTAPHNGNDPVRALLGVYHSPRLEYLKQAHKAMLHALAASVRKKLVQCRLAYTLSDLFCQDLPPDVHPGARLEATSGVASPS